MSSRVKLPPQERGMLYFSVADVPPMGEAWVRATPFVECVLYDWTFFPARLDGRNAYTRIWKLELLELRLGSRYVFGRGTGLTIGALRDLRLMFRVLPEREVVFHVRNPYRSGAVSFSVRARARIAKGELEDAT